MFPFFFSKVFIRGLTIFEEGYVWAPDSMSLLFIIFLQIVLWIITLSKRQYLGLFLLIPVFCGFIPFENLPQKKDHFGVVVFNVGQGLSVLIKTKNHAWLYDTGPPSAGKKVILPLLKFYGVNKLDAIIISHWDLDHRGGLQAIHSDYPAHVITSGNEGDSLCRAGDIWVADGVQFKFLHPVNSSNKVKNKNSCVLLISNKEHSVLIPGDIDHIVEKRILNREELSHVNVLVAAHHGSKYSTSRQLLETLHPDDVVISAGYHNQYHHPHKETLERLQTIHSKAFITYEEGSYVYQG